VRLHILKAYEPTPHHWVAFPVGVAPAGLVWQTQQPLILSDVAAEKRWPRFMEQVRPYGGRCSCQLPLTTARRRLGTLVLVSKQPSAYDAADVGFLQLVANEVALAVENATGNYFKVTQRLPVRIELAEPNPDDTPLFSGLSVVPHVRYKEPATCPGAGQRLHTYGRLRPSDRGRPRPCQPSSVRPDG
jgi:signal transduction protein with GAF and PtsI domain